MCLLIVEQRSSNACHNVTMPAHRRELATYIYIYICMHTPHAYDALSSSTRKHFGANSNAVHAYTVYTAYGVIE